MVSLTSYSQSINDSLLKEINIYLAEGLECKLLLADKIALVKVLDSIIAKEELIVVAMKKQLELTKENSKIFEDLYNRTKEQLNAAEIKKKQLEEQLAKEQKRKKFWRATAIGSTAILAALTYFLLQ